MSNSQLQKIAELRIAGEDYELAANGQAYLVQKSDNDAYGNPVAKVINLEDWVSDSINYDADGDGVKRAANKVQDLLNRIVTLERALLSSRDARLKVGQDIGKETA